MIARPSCRPAASGMSLVELLLVMLLIGVFASISVSMMRDSIESQRLNAAATTLAHEFSNLALQSVRLNRPVEVRFLQNDPAKPEQWTAFQAWIHDPGTGADTPLGPLFRLGEHVTLHSSPEYSGILHLQTASGHPNGFSFHPRGGTSLPRSSGIDSNTNCLTLIPSRFWPAQDKNLPALSRTLSIHPTSGKITLY